MDTWLCIHYGDAPRDAHGLIHALVHNFILLFWRLIHHKATMIIFACEIMLHQFFTELYTCDSYLSSLETATQDYRGCVYRKIEILSRLEKSISLDINSCLSVSLKNLKNVF